MLAAAVAAWAVMATGLAGIVALANAGSLAGCFASLSIQYTHPPAGGGCLTTPGSVVFRQLVLGAALVSILFVPAAYGAGVLAARFRAPATKSASFPTGTPAPRPNQG